VTPLATTLRRTASGIDKIADDLTAEARRLRLDAKRLRDDADAMEWAQKKAPAPVNIKGAA